MAGIPARHIGWMSRYGEQIPLPLEGDGQYQCPHLRDVYILDNGCMRLD
jgi:UDP-2-acetamido-3-amino-2,3-dideoxy-glucuronate N-acetyltransferase